MKKIETPLNSVDVICAATNTSINRLARETGIPVMTLDKFRRTGNVSFGTLEQLSAHIGVTPDDIMFCNLLKLAKAGGNLHCSEEVQMRRHRFESQRKAMQYGMMGEDYVLELERQKLAGKPYAEAVNKAFADNNGPFDILSFDARTGEPIMIEVKATCYSAGRKFVLSRNEIAFMEQCVAGGKRYELHRVYYVHDPARRGLDIYTPELLMGMYDIEPYTYMFRRKSRGGLR